MKFGTLYIIGTPIGNPRDISLRAISVLKRVDVIACEERREAQRLMHRYRLEKSIIEINEHTEREATEHVLSELQSGKDYALISDCGMPVFADPGTLLIRNALEMNIPVEVIPGPTSLTAALSVCGFSITRFYFYGFLSPKKPLRRAELLKLKKFDAPLIFLDAPYRLLQVLEEMRSVFGPHRQVCVACDLTLKEQLIQRGALKHVVEYFRQHTGKREFVIIVDSETGSDI